MKTIILAFAIPAVFMGTSFVSSFSHYVPPHYSADEARQMLV